MSANDHTKLVELLRQFSTAMLVTHHAEHHLRARPMAIAEVEDSGTMWFLSGEKSGKVHEILNDTHVHLTFQKDRSTYLSVSGRASLTHDRDKVAELWEEAFRVWFPGGKDDPDLMLIQVIPEDAEYWDNHGWKKVKYIYESAKSYFTGTTPELDEEAHGAIRL